VPAFAGDDGNTTENFGTFCNVTSADAVRVNDASSFGLDAGMPGTIDGSVFETATARLAPPGALFAGSVMLAAIPALCGTVTAVPTSFKETANDAEFCCDGAGELLVPPPEHATDTAAKAITKREKRRRTHCIFIDPRSP
jgi:hypothetical protein